MEQVQNLFISHAVASTGDEVGQSKDEFSSPPLPGIF